jgi:4-amino-4-deoxy-L-arabinose transferase-like glycosyltransferase
MTEQPPGALRLPRRSSPLAERAGLALVVALFCAPLFVGLDRWDLRSDEAIYSYSVDRILETGDWLTPRSIEVDGPFLEKPPLKFWMVAALMKAGLLPRDEFGMRFLDAVFGAVAFVYVYLFGARLGGVLCGLASTLTLFTFDALIFEHGLRSNNMEAALFLCYCGGMYHLARWIAGDGRASTHAWATCAFFALGFLTKFVAAIFLPLAALVAVACIPEARARLRVAWRTWMLPVASASLAISAWFVYETVVFGRYFWETILGVHVLTRFTSSLDPTHLHPWYYYFDETWTGLARSGGRVVAIFTLVVVAMAAKRGQPWQMRLLAAWWLIPFVLISIGTSKLYHYAYPFLPGLALAVGWVAALFYESAAGSSGVRERLAWLDLTSWSGRRAPQLRAAAWTVAGAAFLLAVVTAIQHQVSWRIGGVKVFQNSSVLRPGLIGVLALAVSGQIALSSRLLAALVLFLALPIWNYPAEVSRVTGWDNPLHVAGECAARVHASAGLTGGVYNAAHGKIHHSHYYYLYRLGEWTEPEVADAAEVHRRLYTPGQETIVLMPVTEYRALQARDPSASAPAVPPGVNLDGVVVVMPGPYQACVTQVRAASPLLAAERPIDPHR